MTKAEEAELRKMDEQLMAARETYTRAKSCYMLVCNSEAPILMYVDGMYVGDNNNSSDIEADENVREVIKEQLKNQFYKAIEDYRKVLESYREMLFDEYMERYNGN